MDIDEMKVGDLKALVASFSPGQPAETSRFIGRYVIVRCRDAGVHAGFLVSASGRGCSLRESRRLYYWVAKEGAFLSGVAAFGLGDGCKIGAPVDIDLTENCEIIACSNAAALSIQEHPNHEPG